MLDRTQIPIENEIEDDHEYTGGAIGGMLFALAIELAVVGLALLVRYGWRLL
jgi:hypothetical protein